MVANVYIVHLVGRIVAIVGVPHLAEEELDAVEPLAVDEVLNVREDLLVLVFTVVVRDNDQAPCLVLLFQLLLERGIVVVRSQSTRFLHFEFKSEILRVVFSDGNEYEYYGVPKAIYVKLVNADTPDRFARRHIYENYLYRSTSKIVGGN